MVLWIEFFPQIIIIFDVLIIHTTQKNYFFPDGALQNNPPPSTKDVAKYVYLNFFLCFEKNYSRVKSRNADFRKRLNFLLFFGLCINVKKYSQDKYKMNSSYFYMFRIIFY